MGPLVKCAGNRNRIAIAILITTCLSLSIGSVGGSEDFIYRKGCKVPFDGRDGICIHLENDVLHCPRLQRGLLEKNFTEIYSAVCGEPNLEKLNETQVCCAVDEFIELYPDFEGVLDKHDNFKLIPTPEESKCGQSFSSTDDRIIGGEAVAPGAHPWMVRLGSVFPGDDDEVRFHCAGSIINDRYILTAAHCLKEGELRVIRLAETDEVTKEECIMETICQEVEDHEPEEIIVHRNYTGKVGSVSDIALIRLKEVIRNISSPFTRPVCLPFIHEFELPDLENAAVTATGPKNLVTVQGWGKEKNEENEGTAQLQEVHVPLRSNVFCRQLFRKAKLTVTAEQICAGGTKAKGSCAGDSGASLLITRQPTNKRTGMRKIQLGIVSYGRQLCGLENSPVVYTRVRMFLKWILDNIRE